MAFVRVRGDHVISDEPAWLDLRAWHDFLVTSYWCEGIPFETFRRAAEHSLCVGLYEQSNGNRRMIGGARVVTDRATYAYLADVYVAEDQRGKGLGVWLVDALLEHPDLRGLRRFALMTRDAHGL